MMRYAFMISFAILFAFLCGIGGVVINALADLLWIILPFEITDSAGLLIVPIVIGIVIGALLGNWVYAGGTND